MKRFFKGFVVAALVLFLAACGSDSSSKDGYYQAAGKTTDTGWTYFITFEMKDGKMTNVNYDGVNLKEGIKNTKKIESAKGRYKLDPKATAPWHEQAEKIEVYIEKEQGVEKITFDKEGKSDAIAGATIHYDDTKDLIAAALEAGPVEQGKMKDGVYFAQDAKPDDKGFRYTLGYFVNHGVILAAHADAYKMAKEDGKPVKQYKTDLAAAGKYDLGKDAAGTYKEQAEAVSQYLVTNQNLDVKVNDEGKTDAISGATVAVGHWVELYDLLSKQSS